MNHINRIIGTIKTEPVLVGIGMCVLAVAIFGASVDNVASAVSAIFFISTLFYIKRWKQSWLNLTSTERAAMLFFLAYTLTCVISYINVTDVEGYLDQLSRYSRFTLFIPIYMLFRLYRVNVFNYFYAGVVISGPVFLGFAIYSDIHYPEYPAAGQYHHIIFGDIAMLNSMIMLAGLIMLNSSWRIRLVVTISILCALYACAMSLARGAWVALPPALLLVLYFGVREKRISGRAILMAIVATAVLVILAPGKQVFVDRVGLALEEYSLYVKGEEYTTSVGSRLGMWNAAVDVWLEHPVIGTGPGDFDQELRELKAAGKYFSNEIHGHVHNIYLQALAVNGTVGFVVLLLALFIMPMKLYFDAYKKRASFEAICGFLFIMSFSIFGLTGDWHYRAPMIAIYMIYFLAITLALYSSRNDATQVDKIV